MTATLETPVQSPMSPKDAIANLVRGNMDLIDKEKAAVPPPEKKTEPVATTTTPAKAPETAKPVETPPAKGADDFDYDNPDPAKPPKNKKHWDGFLDAREKGFKKRDEEAVSAKKELESVRAQITDLQKQASTPRNDAELEALKKERDELKS